MKTGDVYALDGAPGWYIWLKHKIEWREDSPMNLGEGCWIIGIYSGKTAMNAFQQGEVGELVYRIPRGSGITRIGHLSVIDDDIHWPEFYMQTTDGKGGELVYLCRGYDTLKKVKRKKKDVKFSFGMSPDGLVRAISEGYLDRMIAEKSLNG